MTVPTPTEMEGLLADLAEVAETRDSFLITSAIAKALLARIKALTEILTEQTDLVDRLCSAVERAEHDIGGEGALTVLGLLGPTNDRARAALTLKENEDVG